MKRMTTRLRKKARRAKGKEPKQPAPLSALKYPDFAARSKKIFGDRVLNVVEDLLKDRDRDWD
jgi:hypothetical protein